MYESSSIALSQKALRSNLKFIRSLLQPGVKYCSVVKGNAYGHGLLPFVNMAMVEGVNYFGVHAVEEAVMIQQAFPKPPQIFIMGFVEDEAITWAVQHGIEFAVYDFERLKLAGDAARKTGKPAKLHIELETGMQRTGFTSAHWPLLASFLKSEAADIIFQGLFTHFAGAETVTNHFRVQAQENIYTEALLFFTNEGLHPILQHVACSAALLNYPHTQFNMVRIGILQYGYWPNEETGRRYEQAHTEDAGLQRVISWHSKIMALNLVEEGSFVGYGSSYQAEKDMLLATVPVGYAHGYSRNLSNVGQVLINGKVAPILGIINMNSLTADVSACGPVKKGDVVTLIGKQRDNAISVSSFSEQSQLLNYEMLTRLPTGIPRTVTD